MKETNILNRLSEIINDLNNQDLETVTELLNYYNGESVLIDGVVHHAYNSPIIEARLNARYKELTGEDHPIFLQKQEKVIDGLLADKEKLIKAGAYSEEYFENLSQIRNSLNNIHNAEEDVEIEHMHKIDRTNVVDATSSVKISDINKEMQEIKNENKSIDIETQELE